MVIFTQQRWGVALAAVGLSVCAASVQALSYQAGASSTQITQVLDGPGLSISNLVVARGQSEQYGVFTNGKAILSVDSGVFLNTGNLGTLQGANQAADYSFNTKVVYSDPDLTRISTQAKYDPAIVEFDIAPQGDRLNFVFAFGSEEYPEYVCSRFNDAFGLFVSGSGLNGVQNAAFMPDANDPIAVNYVNNGVRGQFADGAGCNLNNAKYFVDNGNGGGSALTQLDGFTRPLTASIAGLQPGQRYRVKLALADAGDPAYDSGAFFKWLTSTKSEPVDLSLQAAATPTTPAWNSDVELTYTVRNHSALPTSLVQVGIELPAGMSWVSDDSGGRYNASSGVWEADVIPANGTKTLKLRARVEAASSYSVASEIQFAFNEDPDSTPYNRTSNPNEDDTAVLTLYPSNKPANQPPIITSNGGAVSASLSIPEGTLAVTTVKATDPEGSNITYSIHGGADAARFSINPQTGALTFNQAPSTKTPTDADRNNVYEVIVAASDGTLTATQTLSVQVTAVTVKNNPPQLTSDGGGSTVALQMEENLTAVTKVTATDPDGDSLKFMISGGADMDLFKITATTGRLSFITPPDFEKPSDADKNNVYEVEVTVSDGELSAKQLIRVQILNVLEGKAPQITSNGGGASATLNVPEGQAAVTTVTATDADGDVLTYRLATGADEALFQINTNSGKLAFIKAPDYENPKDVNQDNVYIVTVMASDGVFETKQLLLITVTDVKENTAPQIISDGGKASATLSSPENQKTVTVATAVDADNDPLTYSITGGADAALFQISSGGTLSFITAPDYEKPHDANKDNIYVVTVTASDPTQSVSQTLNIVITDVFENLPPVITTDNGAAVVKRSIDENQTFVGVISATDPNGEAVTYSISGGSDAAFFKIDAHSGALSFIAPPDYEKSQDNNTDNVYDVIVTVRDTGGLNASQTWQISVRDVEDVRFVNLNLRVFLQGAYDSKTQLMRNDLLQKGLVPSLQPYGELKTAFGYAPSSAMPSPFDYKGKETVSAAVLALQGADAMVDWVLIELRDVFDPGKRIAATAAILQRDGDIIDPVSGAKTIKVNHVNDGMYYVMVRHRHHLAVMTALPVAVSQAGIASVDFSLTSTQVYGGATARLLNGTTALLWTGDVNNSNSIIANGPGSDSSVILGAILVAPENTTVNAAYRLSGYYSTDLNMDGVTVYTGPNNDANLLFGNILLHPDNLGTNANFIVWGKAPLK